MTAVVAAPASAGEFPLLGCASPGGSEFGIFIYDEYDSTGTPNLNSTVTVTVEIGDELVDEASLELTSGHFGVWLDDIFYGDVIETAHVTMTDGTHTSTCDTTYYPAAVDVSGTTVVSKGDLVTLLIDPDVPAFPYSSLTARLEVRSGSSWKSVAEVPITRFGGYGLVSYRPPYSQQVRVTIYSNEPTGAPNYLGASPTFWLGVNFSTATMVSKPSTIVQGKYTSARVAYGGLTTQGDAFLQRYSSGSWVTVQTKQLQSGFASFSWKASAAYTYRVYVKPYGGGSAKVTASFKPAYLPAVSVSAPTSAKYNTYASLAVTHRLATSGTGKVQYLSGSTWKTYKSFTLSASGKTNVSVKVTSTKSWRVVVGSYASSSFRISARY